MQLSPHIYNMSFKATLFHQIPQAVQFNEPVAPEHPFFTDMSGLRGEFGDFIIYDFLNYNIEEKRCYTDIHAREILFLGGMRGSGKTSELARYAKELHHSQGFFVITCNIDEGLNKNNMEYMDILIFQMERLLEESQKREQLQLSDSVLHSLKNWFSERAKEVNSTFKTEGSLEIGLGTPENGISLVAQILGIIGNIKAMFAASYERADKVRQVFRQNFPLFKSKFNEFVEETTLQLRHYGIAQEILFIIDGLEKTLTSDIRRKIILDESGRLQEIKVNTIFTLPIELMKERRQLEQFATVKMFPFVKVQDIHHQPIEAAYKVFRQYIDARIEAYLWEDEALKDTVITYSGGSPRELLRIIGRAYTYSDRKKKQIDANALQKAIQNLATEAVQYLTTADFKELKIIKENNEKGKPTDFNEKIAHLLENVILFEYNDGSLKKVNPIVAESANYKNNVLS